jgi:hypothetical protein
VIKWSSTTAVEMKGSGWIPKGTVVIGHGGRLDIHAAASFWCSAGDRD